MRAARPGEMIDTVDKQEVEPRLALYGCTLNACNPGPSVCKDPPPMIPFPFATGMQRKQRHRRRAHAFC